MTLPEDTRLPLKSVPLDRPLQYVHGPIGTKSHVKVYVVIYEDYTSEQMGNEIMKIAAKTILEKKLGEVFSHRGFLRWLR